MTEFSKRAISAQIAFGIAVNAVMLMVIAGYATGIHFFQPLGAWWNPALDTLVLILVALAVLALTVYAYRWVYRTLTPYIP